MEKKVFSISKRAVIFVLIALLMVIVFSCGICCSLRDRTDKDRCPFRFYWSCCWYLGPRFERGIKLCL